MKTRSTWMMEMILMPFDENIKAADTAVKSLTDTAKKELIKAYSESLKSIRSIMSFIYEKYSTDGSLSYADMTKYNRLIALEKEIKSELSNLAGQSAGIIKTLSAEVYQEAYFRTAFAIEVESQAKLAYGMINPKIIEASIQNPISGLTLNERLIKNKNNIIISIRQQITQGLIQGEAYPKMAKRIKDTLEGDAKKALRVVQSESHRVQQEGRIASMEHAAGKGVKMVKVWHSAFVGEYRKSHAKLDGAKVGIDELFYVRGHGTKGPGLFGIAEEDINCHCTVRPEIEGYGPELRRVRGEGVIPYSNFNEWRDNRLDL